MLKNENNEISDKPAFIIAYILMALSGGVVGFCLGLFTAWLWWG